MRRASRLFNQSTDEIGWISTTDIFVVGCCILLFAVVGSKRQTVELEGKLDTVVQQLEMSKTEIAQDSSAKIEAIRSERQNFVAQLATANERIKQLDDQSAQEEVSRSNEKQASAATIRALDEAVIRSEAENTKLRNELALARQSMVAARDQAISQQRTINNKLVGLGGKLENVVFMVDVSRSMQSGKDPNGVVLNNWVPIVEVIERWVNGLNVTSAALIVFGDSAEVKVPMQSLSEGGRERILEVLKQIDPNAEATNFLAAFEEAYRISNVDTIIVFSDGLPSVDINGNRIFVAGRNPGEDEDAYNARFAVEVTDNVNRVLAVHRRISEMAREHPSVAVNVIGLGAGVYNEKTGNLLNDLALKNGGVFLALPSRILEDQKP